MLALDVVDTCDKHARAASFAPDAVVASAGRCVVVVAREELALIDPQLPLEEMQFFHAGMGMSRVTRAGREAYQHADLLPLRVGRKQLAFNPRCNLFPFWLSPPLPGRQHQWLAALARNTQRKARLQPRSRMHIGMPEEIS